jgi:hypothetical protein
MLFDGTGVSEGRSQCQHDITSQRYWQHVMRTMHRLLKNQKTLRVVLIGGKVERSLFLRPSLLPLVDDRPLVRPDRKDHAIILNVFFSPLKFTSPQYHSPS